MVVRSRPLACLLAVATWMLVDRRAAGQIHGEPSPTPPESFGTQDYTVTRVTALGFFPAESGQAYHTSGSLGRFGDVNVDQHFYAPVEIPEGAVVDYVGLNNLNDLTPGAITLTLRDRNSVGTVYDDGEVDSTAHDNWLTDRNSTPLGIVWQFHDAGFLDIHVAASPNMQFFGYAEVWWRRSVSPPPMSASFNDVPTSHPFFQYIEALKASGITGGCQAAPPLYCPDATVTRGQMAVFLAKALGLHWPN